MQSSRPCSARAAIRLSCQPRRASSVIALAKKEQMDDSEERLEAYEQYIRSGKKMSREDFEKVAERRKEQVSSQPKTVVWKEGQLFPEGWDQMDPLEKMTQIYMGERGALFWANKAAYASAFIIGGAWILFRFVGPALGLYELAGGPPQP